MASVPQKKAEGDLAIAYETGTTIVGGFEANAKTAEDDENASLSAQLACIRVAIKGEIVGIRLADATQSVKDPIPVTEQEIIAEQKRSALKQELTAASQQADALTKKIIADTQQVEVLEQKLTAHKHQKQELSVDLQQLDALSKLLKS